MDQGKIGRKGWRKKSAASEIYEIPVSIAKYTIGVPQWEEAKTRRKKYLKKQKLKTCII